MEEKSVKKSPAKTPRSPTPELSHFRLVIAYQGTHYEGWQKQAREGAGPTVQDLLQQAAAKVLKQTKITLHGSGRTDSGVHARGQVAHLRAKVDLPPKVLIKAINAHLPDDIRVLRLEPCAPDFHAQLHAKRKTYRYFLLHTNTGKDPIHWPFLRPYTWFVTFPLHYAAMSDALARLEGTHDFRSFQNIGTPVEDTVREILTAKLVVHGGDPRENPPWMPSGDFEAKLLEIRVTGSGFLKQMVRNIVGTVVEVGRGKLAPAHVDEILARKDRKAGGMTAPAQGLFLDEVSY